MEAVAESSIWAEWVKERLRKAAAFAVLVVVGVLKVGEALDQARPVVLVLDHVRAGAGPDLAEGADRGHLRDALSDLEPLGDGTKHPDRRPGFRT
jgi:hypothetical protein